MASLDNASTSYGAINVSQSESAPKNVHPIILLYREVKSGRQRIGPVVLFSLIAVIGAAFNGFMLGFTAVLQINMSTHSYPDESSNMKYIGGISTIGALIAGLIAGLVSDKVGRKLSFMLASVPYVMGFLCLALSYSFIHKFVVIPSSPQVPYLSLLLIGRALTGFGAGCLSLIVPVYVSEIAPSSLRGLFGSLNQLAVTIGILLVYLSNTFIPYYITSLIVVGLTLCFVVCVLILPESPRWLVANGKDLEANNVLFRLRGGKADIPREMADLQKAVESQKEFGLFDKLAMFRRPAVLVPLLLSLTLMFFQQFCGINVVIFYAGTVLEDANVKGRSGDYAADFGVGVIQVIATFISVLLVDLVGRKILLSIGGVLLALSTGILGLYFFLTEHECHTHGHHAFYCNPHFGYLAVGCLAIFIIGFSIGWGPIPWLMMTELAPLQVRGIMSGIATTVNWSFAAIITFGFNDFEKGVQPYGAWWTFCVICVLSVIFSIVFLPETKGKSLEDIEEYFNNRFGNGCGGEPNENIENSID